MQNFWHLASAALMCVKQLVPAMHTFVLPNKYLQLTCTNCTQRQPVMYFLLVQLKKKTIKRRKRRKYQTVIIFSLTSCSLMKPLLDTGCMLLTHTHTHNVAQGGLIAEKSVGTRLLLLFFFFPFFQMCGSITRQPREGDGRREKTRSLIYFAPCKITIWVGKPLLLYPGSQTRYLFHPKVKEDVYDWN